MVHCLCSLKSSSGRWEMNTKVNVFSRLALYIVMFSSFYANQPGHVETNYGWPDIIGSQKFVEIVSKYLTLMETWHTDDFKFVFGPGGTSEIDECYLSRMNVTNGHECMSDIILYSGNSMWVESYFVGERYHRYLYTNFNTLEINWYGDAGESFCDIKQAE